jgi:hypothetical protein
MHNGVREDFGRIKAVGAELEGDAAAEIGESDEVI